MTAPLPSYKSDVTNPASALIRLARPRQWVKNGFVAAPLFFTPEAVTRANLALIAVAVISFCLLSSAIYVFNDWCDREADRAHPAKRMRPIAAGAVSPAAGLVFAVLLAAAGFALAAVIPSRAFFAFAAAYAALSVLYSARLKHVAVLDVIVV